MQTAKGRPRVIAASLDHDRTTTLDEALALVGASGTDVIAGAINLPPLMKRPLASPDRLLDIIRADAHQNAMAAAYTRRAIEAALGRLG
jgi:CO/xanthine dehydrogenase FAD-binding subunit